MKKIIVLASLLVLISICGCDKVSLTSRDKLVSSKSNNYSFLSNNEDNGYSYRDNDYNFDFSVKRHIHNDKIELVTDYDNKLLCKELVDDYINDNYIIGNTYNNEGLTFEYVANNRRELESGVNKFNTRLNKLNEKTDRTKYVGYITFYMKEEHVTVPLSTMDIATVPYKILESAIRNEDDEVIKQYNEKDIARASQITESQVK